MESPRTRDESKTQHHRTKLPAWVVLAVPLTGILILEALYFVGVIPYFPVGSTNFLAEIILLVFLVMIVKSLIQRPSKPATART